MQQVGGLVGRVLAGLAAVDGDDPIARPHAGLLGRAAADHADDHQRAALGLQLDAQSDEAAVDLGIDFAELVGREIGRIGVERIGGAAEVLQDHDRGRQAQALLGQVGRHHGAVAGFHPIGHAALGQRLAELAAEGLHRGRIAAGQVPLQEDRLAQAPSPGPRCPARRGPSRPAVPRNGSRSSAALADRVPGPSRPASARRSRQSCGRRSGGPGRSAAGPARNASPGRSPRGIAAGPLHNGPGPRPNAAGLPVPGRAAGSRRSGSIARKKQGKKRPAAVPRPPAARPAPPMPQTRERLPQRAFVAWCRPCGGWNAAWAWSRARRSGN